MFLQPAFSGERPPRGYFQSWWPPIQGGPVAGHNRLYSICSGAASVYSAVASLSISFLSLNLIGIDLALIL